MPRAFPALITAIMLGGLRASVTNVIVAIDLFNIPGRAHHGASATVVGRASSCSRRAGAGRDAHHARTCCPTSAPVLIDAATVRFAIAIPPGRC